MTPLMSTSLKVVSMAAVFWASFSRRAIVWRSLVIRTRSSRAASVGRRGRARSRWQEPAPERVRARGACTGASSRSAVSTSPFSTCPRLPEPSTAGRVDTILGRDLGRGGRGRHGGLGGGAGLGGPRHPSLRGRLLGLGGRRRGLGCRAARLDLAEQGAGRDGLAVLDHDFGQHPCARRIHFERDLVGLEFQQHLVRLDRRRPAFLNHLPIVASETDLPRVGTRISVAIVVCPARAE